MLKRFFITVLGTMAGFWISIVVVMFGGLMLAGVMLAKSGGDNAVEVKKNSILYFNLSGDVAERYQPTSFMAFLQSQGMGGGLTLDEMIRSLEAAADDDRIEGLYMNCNGASMGSASREELLQAIEKFKKSGKWIVAYADGYSQGDYLLASTAGHLVLNPMGSVDIHGVGGMTPFFKGLLDKLGVKMQIVKVGTFKSAVEPYILNKMSEPARLQMQQYVDSIWNFTAGAIADNRKLTETNIKELAPQMISARIGEYFVEQKLADKLEYRRQIELYLKDLCDLDEDDDLRLVSPADYLSARSDMFSTPTSKKHIAVYYAVGDISDSGKEGIVGQTVVEDIVSLADDKNVEGLVFRVNSPGGSAFASEQIWEAIQYFKSKDKPVYVSMGDYAASGGYYISCGADKIFADRTTLTGSIGVFGMIPDFSGLITDKIGVSFSTVETNPNATGISAVGPMTETQYAAMQKSVEEIYDLFTGRVAAGRGMSQDSVKAIAEGRVWTGGRAIEIGLVDRLGSLQETIGALADELDMDADRYVQYPRYEEKFWEKLMRQSELDIKLAEELDVETLRALNLVKTLREAAPVQARMEYIEVR